MHTFTGAQLRAAVDDLQLASWAALECTACSKRSGFLFNDDGTIARITDCRCHIEPAPPAPCEWDDLATLINTADDRTRQRWAAMFGLDAGLPDEELPGGPGDGRPIVWAMCVGTVLGDQHWVAYTHDGRTIAQHTSSSAVWGRQDVGPGAFPSRDATYVEMIGTCDPAEIDYRVVPVGGDVPPQVRRAIACQIARDRSSG